jgi:hypothetical protein
MSPYTPHARIIDEELVQGHAHEPTPEQLEKIEAYREAYLRMFDVYPAGSHWVDTVGRMVLLRRPGGLPGCAAEK